MFRDRVEAGEKLANVLLEYKSQDPIVIALPRGGVPIGSIIAGRLECELDLLLIKKVGFPGQPELAAGAVCEGIEEPVFNSKLMNAYGVTPDDLMSTIVQKRQEIERQKAIYREHHQLKDLTGKTVILVDDGLATGTTAQMAILGLKKRNPLKVVLAVPVASRDAIEKVSSMADEVIALSTPTPFYAVGQWYDNFDQVSDQEVLELLSRHANDWDQPILARPITIEKRGNTLRGVLKAPRNPKAWVIFAHGSGSSHMSPRNQKVAGALVNAGYGTMLFDLLTHTEELDRDNVFDIGLLARRLSMATDWLLDQQELSSAPLVYFGASTGAGAALVAAANRSDIEAVVSRGGRPDLAGHYLRHVTCPVLLVVGEWDEVVLDLNRQAKAQLRVADLAIIPKATHLFEERGALEQVADEIINWLDVKMTAISTRKKVS